MNNSSSRNFTKSRIVLWLGECGFRSQMLLFISWLQTLGRLWISLCLTSLISKNEEDNITDLVWLFYNSLLGISKNIKNWAGSATDKTSFRISFPWSVIGNCIFIAFLLYDRSGRERTGPFRLCVTRFSWLGQILTAQYCGEMIRWWQPQDHVSITF